MTGCSIFMSGPERFGRWAFFWVVLILASSAWGEGLQEGEWQLTSRTEVAGAAYAMPALSYSRCIKREMLIPAQEVPGRQCKLINERLEDDRYQWHLRCQTQDKAMEVHGEALYAGGKVQASVRLISGNMTRISHIQGERVGPCR